MLTFINYFTHLYMLHQKICRKDVETDATLLFAFYKIQINLDIKRSSS